MNDDMQKKVSVTSVKQRLGRWLVILEAQGAAYQFGPMRKSHSMRLLAQLKRDWGML